MSHRPHTPFAVAWGLSLLAGLVLLFGPSQFSDQLKRLTADAALAGLTIAESLFPAAARTGRQPPAPETAEKRSLQRTIFTLEHRIAQLERELARHRKLDTLPLQPEPLLTTGVAAATVLGETGELSPLRRRLVNLGRNAGLSGDELVIDGEGLLLDQGTEAGLEADQLVTDGRSIAGRIGRVGRWTSTVQSLTDPGFRAAARLVRRSPTGPVFGARGVLAGAGGACRLENVPASEAVNVGDAVYSDDPAVSRPLVFGYVSQAVLGQADPFWTIVVTPTVDPHLSQVVVIKSQFNPERIAARP